VLADKTGSLIATAAEVGVIFSNADTEFIQPLRTFGEKIGVAFQLVDDIIDLSSEIETTGKQAGTDLRSGVATLPLLFLRERARGRSGTPDLDAADLLTRLERDLNAEFYGEGDEADLAAAIAELRAHPVTSETLDEANRWAQEAVTALDPLPEGPVKKALTRFAQGIVERSG
jgi:heptaprenyl diphosphate synthase